MRHRERKDTYILKDSVPYSQSKVYDIPWFSPLLWPAADLALRQEICDDELHGPPPYKGSKDMGGPLDLWKFDHGSPIGPTYYLRSNNLPDSDCLYQYKGRFVLPPYSTDPQSFISWRDKDWGDASDYGATGWNKYKPAKPGVDLGVTLAEMRETVKTLMTRARAFKDIFEGRRNLPTNMAGNMLEYNFGWAPLFNDIKKAIDTYQSLDSMIDRIRKMNGQWEHRGGPVDSQRESWTEHLVSSGFLYIGNTYFYAGLPLPHEQGTDLEFTFTSETWFEGAFKYYIPDIDTPEWAAKARRKLMGLNLNPSLVWELVPWSWLVDWITNAGDVFSNMDPGLAENLTAAYAYVMRTTTYSVNKVCTLRYLERISPRLERSHTQSILTRWQRKHRVAASPFGFGIDFGSFSPKQIAIMAALGLSRT